MEEAILVSDSFIAGREGVVWIARIEGREMESGSLWLWVRMDVRKGWRKDMLIAVYMKMNG